MNYNDQSTFNVPRQAIDIFAKMSADFNPLHTSSEYASRTPFGKQVVFGALPVSVALSIAQLNNPGRSISSLKCSFKKALLMNESFSLSFEKNYDQIKILNSSDQLITKIKLGWQDSELHLPITQINVKTKTGDSMYSIDEKAAIEFYSLFNLPIEVPHLQTPATQCLLWSSWYVGMKEPGEQALYTELKASLPKRLSEIKLAETTIDERFNIFNISASLGAENLKLSIQAMMRPKPIVITANKCQGLDSKNMFEEKAVAVLGGSRGLGAALAINLAKSGCKKVDISYKRNKQQAEIINGELKSFCETDSYPISFDTDSNESKWTDRAYDYVFLNAFPPIPNKKFEDYKKAEYQTELSLLQSFLFNQLQVAREMALENASFVFVSSQYADTPEPGFSAYSAAKAGFEAFLKTMARENKTKNFFIVQFPKMLTDQTNSLLDLGEMKAPEEMAKECLIAMQESIVEKKDNLNFIKLWS